MKKFLVAIDQGTTSSRTILFDVKGNIRFKSQLEFKQYFPKNGWVEHNPMEIWNTTLKTLKNVIKKAFLITFFKVFNVVFQISIGLCSTHPFFGKYCLNSNCDLNLILPFTSNSIVLDDVVP